MKKAWRRGVCDSALTLWERGGLALHRHCILVLWMNIKRVRRSHIGHRTLFAGTSKQCIRGIQRERDYSLLLFAMGWSVCVGRGGRVTFRQGETESRQLLWTLREQSVTKSKHNQTIGWISKQGPLHQQVVCRTFPLSNKSQTVYIHETHC